MAVRARFYVRTFTLQAGETAEVRLDAVSRGTENSQWSKFTPSGQLTLALTREASGAREFFRARVGKEIFLDFTDAERPPCTQCGEIIEDIPDAHEDFGSGVHTGADGYVPGEYVHNRCLPAAKARLGLDQ